MENKIAIISDVHANAYALDAVFKDLKFRKIDRIYCLGDVVGYNAMPHETLGLLMEAGIPTIKGNHDMMATGELAAENCGPNAKTAILWTRTELNNQELAYLKELPGHLTPDAIVLMVHSKLGDPVGYLKSHGSYLDHHQSILERFPSVRVCFTGHTHVRRAIEIEKTGGVQEISSDFININPERFYFINPGSVGHPRRSDYRASYAILDLHSLTIRFMSIGYAKKKMSLANSHHHIQTDLGPGAIRHWIGSQVRNIKAMVRT